MKRLLFLLLLCPSAYAAQTWPAGEGTTFTNDTGAAIQVQLCNKDSTGCSLSRTVAAGESLNCGYFNFYSTVGVNMPPDPQYRRACVIMGVATPQVPPAGSGFVVCDIAIRPDIWNQLETGAGPDGLYYLLWPCKDGTVQGQMGTSDEVKELLANKPKDRDSANAYAAGKPVTEWTPEQLAFLRQKREAYRVKLGLPAPSPPAPHPVPQSLVVQHVAGKTGVDDSRPLYKLKADGTIGSAITKPRATAYTVCNPDKRVGTTSYYEVPLYGPGLYAICGLVP